MLRYVLIFLAISCHAANAQLILSREDAVNLALNNQRNLKAGNLSVQQQQQLLGSAAAIDNPQVQVEASPYEPLVAGVQQSFSLPGVYRNRKVLQQERVRLAQLQLQGSQLDLKREVQLSFLQLQYLEQRNRLLYYQDSIYGAIKASSKRFFEAGQINKLEELQASSQADRISNDNLRVQADLAAEKQIFRFYIGYTDSFTVEPLGSYAFMPVMDTAVSNIEQQILRQQIAISERELRVERSELLPQFQAGVLFPTTRDYERPIGFQAGVTIPIWVRQNRSRIAAARTAVEVATALQDLEQQRLNARFRQAIMQFEKEAQSLSYFNNTALPQARAIIETSQRLFDGGQLNYIESLRNLQSAFDLMLDRLEAQRSYNEAVIELNYLNGSL